MPKSHFSHRHAVLLGALILLAATLVAFAAASEPASARTGANARVINGRPVDGAAYDARWRSIATLVLRSEPDVRKGHFCDATFVAADVLATAAHCVVDNSKLLAFDDGTRIVRYNNARAEDPKLMQVLAGRRVLSARDGDRIDVAHVRVHPRYDAESNINDVALIKLKRAPKAAAGVVPVLPVQNGEDAIWGNGAGIAADPTRGPWVAGWGVRFLPNESFLFTGANHVPIKRPTKPGVPAAASTGSGNGTSRNGRDSSLPDTLEEALIPIRSDHACDVGGAGEGVGYGRTFDAATMLCAGTLDTSDANDANALSNGVDSCYGDSGGPVLASTGGALRLVGIVSFGTGCATRDTYGVYTRVAAMRDFLTTVPTRNVRLAARPPLGGSSAVGGVLTCGPGRWTGAGKIRYSYRWIREPFDNMGLEIASDYADEAYERVPGSTNRRAYRVKAADKGTRIGCLVIATNGSTTAVENSNLVKVPGAQRPDPEEEADDGDEDDDEDYSLHR